MPMTGIQSQIIGAAQPTEETAREANRDPNDPLDFNVPNMGQAQPGTEVHQFEFTPNGGNGVVLSLALTIKPGHGGANPATPSGSASARSHTNRGDRDMAGGHGQSRFGGYKQRAAEQFLADIDLFLTDNKEWGEISLLLAGNIDHRLFARIRAGEGFRIDSLERVAETMNQAEAGSIAPETYRAKRRKAAGGDGSTSPATEGGSDDRQPDESSD